MCEAKIIISAAPTRLEISSGADPKMAGINSFVTLTETAETVGQVWHFDQTDGKFVD